MITIWSHTLEGYLSFFKGFDYQIHNVPTVPTDGIVLALGDKVLGVLKKEGLIAKNRTLASLQDEIYAYENAYILPTYHPEDIEEDYNKNFDLIWRLKQLIRYEENGSFDVTLPPMAWVSDLTELCGHININKWVAFDIETQGSDPFNSANYIICFTFSSGEYSCGVYINGQLPKKIHEQLNYLLNEKSWKVEGANLKYDLLWLKVKYGITCTNFACDTTLIGSLLDENRSNSLTLHSRIFTPWGGYDSALNKKYDKNNMAEVPIAELGPYAIGDAIAEYKVGEVFRAQLQEEEKKIRKVHKRVGPMNFYQKLLHPIARVFEDIEYRGIYVDLEYLNELETQVENEIAEVSQQALKLIPKSLQRKYKDNLSITRASLLQEYLFTPEGLNLEPFVVTAKSHKPSTSYKDHLYKFKTHPKAGKFIEYLKRYSELNKILSTYITGFKTHIREDGKFHPSVILHRGSFEDGSRGGTVTGRIGWKNPPLMVLPSHTIDADRIRKMFVAPPGYMIIGADLSQAELRLVAHLSKDPVMMQAFREGKDLHKVTAYNTLDITEQQFYELPIEKQKHYRQVAKSQNFGLVYVMGFRGLQVYAEKSYGVAFSLDDAQKYYTSFHETYKNIKPWHKKCISHAYEHGYMVSLLGRIRHLPQIYSSVDKVRQQAERRSTNAPVQADASDLNLLAVLEISKDPHIHVWGTIHDSIYAYAPEHKAIECAKKLKWTMENLPTEQFGCSLSVPLVADVKIGYDLASLEEIK
jgi:DNA polymerase I-like protein with 3'-5' exonuclease and polymerase domains